MYRKKGIVWLTMISDKSGRKWKLYLTSTTVSETCKSILVISLTWEMSATDIGCRKNRKRRKHSIGIFLFIDQYTTRPGVLPGQTSRSFDRSREPRPAPVPPPSEWIIWNPCNASVASDCLRTMSKMPSINSAPVFRTCQAFHEADSSDISAPSV